jgi:hypothetical protein
MALHCQIPHTENSSYLRNLAVPLVFERPSYVTRWRRTGWLGRKDSNLRIRIAIGMRHPARRDGARAAGADPP